MVKHSTPRQDSKAGHAHLKLAWSAPGPQQRTFVTGTVTVWLGTGWPLSSEVLAALNRLKPDDRRRIENGIRGEFLMALLPKS